MTDSRGTLTIIFFKEGTFRGGRVYSRSAKTIFGTAADSASGTWGFGNSTLEAYVQATTAHDLVSLDRKPARNSDRMLCIPLSHFAVGPSPLERVSVDPVVLLP